MKLLPAEVKSWDGVKMRIAIPGYTDGADQFPEAEICYPLADRPADTGYKILLVMPFGLCLTAAMKIALL